MNKASNSLNREIHYVCDSGRVEGLILHKEEETEQEERSRPSNRGEDREGLILHKEGRQRS